MVKGNEYDKQVSMKNENGTYDRPDAIIYLPEEKHILIDSKVSLTAYDNYVNADSEEEGARFLKLHIDSVKKHIKELCDKNYQNNGAVNCPDLVLMFMPVEPSFSAAHRADVDIFHYAWERKIVIVSPSTLLATLRTISSIWKQERQTKNSLEIAQEGGKLYDKIAEFCNQMMNIGNNIDRTQKAYHEAIRSLKEQRGNILSRAEKMRKLGAKTSKELPVQLLPEFEEEV